jgi:cation:H+ antiporter
MSSPETAPAASTRVKGRSSWILIAAAVLGCLPWTALALGGFHPGAPLTALLTGLAILSAAFLLSWGVEVAELDLPQALAVSILALLAVLPEYAVDAAFAWKAARDPSFLGYALANMTGANRLLIGVGWSMVVFLAWWRYGKPGIRLAGSYGIDIAVLLIATLYSIVPLVRGSLNLMDTAVLMGLYVLYVVAAARSGREEEPNLVGPARAIEGLGKRRRRVVVVFFFLLAGTTILLAAEPFSESLVHVGTLLGIDEFLLVQWLAPLASEAPEMAVAALLVWHGRAGAGMRTLVSSKVNQWTLLVGTLPLVFSISGRHMAPMHLDARQSEEIALTAAQSLFGIVVIADGHVHRLQAVALFTLFFLQLLVPDPTVRWVFAGGYVLLSGIILAASHRERHGIVASFKDLSRTLRGGRRAERA